MELSYLTLMTVLVTLLMNGSQPIAADERGREVSAGEVVRFVDNPLTTGTVTALPGSRVEIGYFGKVDRLDAFSADVEMTGGSVYLTQLDNSEFTIASGATYSDVILRNNSRLTVLGGGHYGYWIADDSSEIEIVGTAFSTPTYVPQVTEAIQQLSLPGDSYVIDRRTSLDDVNRGSRPFIIGGTLADGRQLQWELSEKRRVIENIIDIFEFREELVVHPDAIARVTIAFPEGFCDIDRSGNCDLLDIDALRSEFGSESRSFDLNYDRAVDEGDLQMLLWNGFAGDANLDGVVDSKDLNVVAVHWQAEDVAGWSNGDFDNDGRVGASDLNAIGANWTAIPKLAAVPEPSPCDLLLVAFIPFFRLTRRKI